MKSNPKTLLIANNVDKAGTHKLVDHIRSSDEFRLSFLLHDRLLVAYRNSV